MQVLHLHIRLFLLAHLFLERNLYTSGLRGHDYAKYDHVSYEEAMAVAGFWGLVNPTESKLLMHLSELYCVCEPRVYCTVLLRQAAANAFVMEIHIAHPLVQLPAGL